MKIVIAENYKIMSDLVARLVIKQIRHNNQTILALPTGGTPIGFYKNLVKAVKQKKVSFKQVKIFNLDEYVGLDESDSHSFHAFMRARLLNFIDIKRENIFVPDGMAKNLKQAGANYESLIKKYGGIDLAVLGIGLDGHVGFNEPGSDFNSKTRVVKLTEKTRRSNLKYFHDLEQVPHQAITMGLGTITKAKKIILIASGEKKSNIIKRALTGKATESLPASILQKHKNLTVVLEKRAGKFIKFNQIN